MIARLLRPRTWLSQDAALTNAAQASVRLMQQRRQREQVEAMLEALETGTEADTATRTHSRTGTGGAAGTWPDLIASGPAEVVPADRLRSRRRRRHA